MTIEEAERKLDFKISCPFILIDEMDGKEFEEFIHRDAYGNNGFERDSVINLLNIILSKGGCHEKEMIIYKALKNE